MINGYSVAFEQYALLSPCCSSHGWEVEMVSAYNLDNKADITYLGESGSFRLSIWTMFEYSWSGWFGGIFIWIAVLSMFTVTVASSIW